MEQYREAKEIGVPDARPYEPKSRVTGHPGNLRHTTLPEQRPPAASPAMSDDSMRRAVDFSLFAPVTVSGFGQQTRESLQEMSLPEELRHVWLRSVDNDG